MATQLTKEKSFTVSEKDTAKIVGSGSLPVLATPIMIAWMENTAMTLASENCNMTNDDTTVGILMNAQHIKASAVGETICCKAQLDNQDGRKLTFSITCTNSNGETIGTAIHERFIVNAERFMDKLNSSVR